MQMNMQNERFNIVLTVAGDKFPLTIPRSDEEVYRRAAKMIDDKLNLFRSRYGENIADKQMKMVALTMAVNLVKTEHLSNAAPVFERLEQLDKEVQELLKD